MKVRVGYKWRAGMDKESYRTIEGTLLTSTLAMLSREVVIKEDNGAITFINDDYVHDIELLEDIPDWLTEDYASDYGRDSALLHRKMTREQHRMGLDKDER